MKNIKILGLLSVLVLSTSMLGNAQIVLTTTSGNHSYTQNFNGLPTTGNPVWTDNTTLLGWYATPSAALPFSGQIVATTGANGNFLASFGSSSAADRALGANPGGADKLWGARLQNIGSTAMTINTISFTGEQWRTRANATAQSVTFGYQVSTSPITSISTGTYSSVGGLTFTSPVTSPIDTNLNGNLSANRVSLSLGSLGITIAAGSEAMLRWSYLDGSGNDANLGIDDLTVAYTTAVPEPSTFALVLISLVGGAFLIRRCRRSIA